MNTLFRFCSFFVLILMATIGWAQPKLEFDLKKPKQFQERQLGSEKMADKKYTIVRRFFQNNYTHYNYYFNANEKLKSIVAYATQANKDDYTTLLSFYPYSLTNTKTSTDLDSILQTATAGILLHDLRNDWIDNLYLAMGKAYLLRQHYDSAMMAFQYLNYSYAPKEKGGFDQPIGSNGVEGGNALSISTKEKNSLTKKIFSQQPSRNESFVWMIRTLTENGNYIDASSLISTLRNDPVFPERLHAELNQANAYLNYKTETWDTAAVYSEKSIELASGAEEKSRAWFLTGQLYQLAGKYDKASAAFEKCTQMAVDPVMDIYARLNMIRMRKSDDPSIIDKNIDELMAMARKDRYINYRDIIHYAAALFEMERNGYDAALRQLRQSIATNTTNQHQRSQSFLLMGDVNYTAKKYGDAFMPYDSVNVMLAKKADSLRVEVRKPGTEVVNKANQIITLQDSLLRLGQMPENDRIGFVRNVAKQLRKARGLKEETGSGFTGSVAGMPGTAAPADMFGTTTSGNWYFYDPQRRANGFNAFRERWGGRTNSDNWRRSSAQPLVAQNQPAQRAAANSQASDIPAPEAEKFDTTDISFDNLYSRIPVSAERQAKANSRIIQALYQKATALHEQIEDYPEAIKVYEEILARTDTGAVVSQSLFALIHCYTAVGNSAAANAARQKLSKQFAGSDLAQKASGDKQGKALEAKNDAATRQYEKIYNLFLEGNFDQALALKKQADSAYGRSYWTPQLLYIETVHLLQTKQDSVANRSLQNIIVQFADHPLAQKAKLIQTVLPKRKEIEDYLTKYEMQRIPDDVVTMAPADRPKPVITTPTKTAATTIAPTTVTKPVVDSSKNQLKPVVTEVVSPYLINPSGPQVVALVLENIDPAYINEASYSIGSSPKRNMLGSSITVEKKKLKDKLWLLLLRSPSFTSADAAYSYIEFMKPIMAKEILAWLDVKKYHFILLSDENINLLAQDPNLPLYEQVLKSTFPGKF